MKKTYQRLVSACLLILSFIFFCGVDACDTAYDPANGFNEGWERTLEKTYQPSSVGVTTIQGDMGYWLMGDTVSSFLDCGPTPHTAEIITHNSSKALKLTSNESTAEGGCADNVWIVLYDTSTTSPLQYNKGFSIPLTSSTHISFSEEGYLEGITLRSSGRKVYDSQNFLTENTSSVNREGWDTSGCVSPPCFDNISLMITDNHGNTLAYVLQYPGSASENENYSFYKEIFLDSETGTYERNLYNDFSTIPAFNPSNAEIVSIQFKIDEHGWAIIDDLNISSNK